MTGHAKIIDLTFERRKGSDFGAVFPACKDEALRHRVAKAIHTARLDESKPLDNDEIREVATYISELEDIILRHHWGEIQGDDLLCELKASTGLDIEKK